MQKKMLWKDIKKCFAKSKGRFISILCLVALGSFALVGLQVAGPDMRKTGEAYFAQLKLTDISVIGDYGIDDANVAAINQVTGAERIEYGYLKDVVISGTQTSIRVFSETDGISEYELVAGRMPEQADEIAIASFLQDKYAIGDTLPFSEKEDIAGNTVLRTHTPRIVGFVHSSELLSIINMGQSTAGTGELQGYAVVTKAAFDSEVYMIARLAFADTKNVDPYSAQYTDLIAAHKAELDALLADQPSLRLASIKAEYQAKIDDAQAQIDEGKAALADAKAELTEGMQALQTAKQRYATGIAQYQAQKATAERQLRAAAAQLDTAKQQITAAETSLAAKRTELEAAQTALASARQTLDAGWADYQEKAAQLEELAQTKDQLDAAQADLDAQIAAAEARLGMTIDEIEAALPTLQQTLPAVQYEQLRALIAAKQALAAQWAAYQAAASQAAGAVEQLASARQALEAGEADYAAQQKEFDDAQAQLQAASEALAQKKQELAQAENAYQAQKTAAEQALASAKAELDAAAATIAEKEQTLADGWAAYNQQEPDAQQKIADAEDKVASAQRALDGLRQPVYALDTRREVPGSEGYRVYGTISEIVDALADVFPIFLYFVAALVTLTTMTRFVDEERINSGTLKALGYSNRDIVKKFTVYGLSAGLSGAVLGIAAGHTLLPMIVYNAYGTKFTYPKLELHFYPLISCVALLLALLCAVVPAYLVANRTLREKPAALLQPKPPEAGSQIMLERIRPIWNRLSFTHKVTARNIFRYKKRMLMTIFGVCGSVTLIFAGFSVQHSISGVKDRQFGEILKYDLIVAENDGLDVVQTSEIEALLTSSAVKRQMPLHYETVSKTAGKNQDSQSIKLIVPDDAAQLSAYIRLGQRASGKALALTDDGCVITERLAKLLGLKTGDTLTFLDENKQAHTVTVAGITEMYTGHFIFMDRACYELAFSTRYLANAHLVTLVDRSADNAKLQASQFIALSGVKGVVQNTTMTNQIDTIVHSLNRIMEILIIVAILLAGVILYNLTNINVSGRIRELSTIKVLGFYNKEVTMYIYRETILLTALGILVGFGLGDLLYDYILAVVPPDEVIFNPALGWNAFVIPVIVIAGLTAILGAIINRRLKRVDMLEALKSVD